jgi:hypothetical protein
MESRTNKHYYRSPFWGKLPFIGALSSRLSGLIKAKWMRVAMRKLHKSHKTLGLNLFKINYQMK